MRYRIWFKFFILFTLIFVLQPNFALADTYSIDPASSYVLPSATFSLYPIISERIPLSGSLNFTMTNNLYGIPFHGRVTIDTSGIEPTNLPQGPMQLLLGGDVTFEGSSFRQEVCGLWPPWESGFFICSYDVNTFYFGGSLSGGNLELSMDYPTGQWTYYDIHIEATAVPEPITMLLLGIGLIGIAGIEKRIH